MSEINMTAAVFARFLDQMGDAVCEMAHEHRDEDKVDWTEENEALDREVSNMRSVANVDSKRACAIRVAARAFCVYFSTGQMKEEP